MTLIQRWKTDVGSTLKYSYLFNVTIKILIFQASLYKNKFVSRVNSKLTLFQSWILSMYERCPIDVESRWISGWATSGRYFTIYQRWINVECLLGIDLLFKAKPFLKKLITITLLFVYSQLHKLWQRLLREHLQNKLEKNQ